MALSIAFIGLALYFTHEAEARGAAGKQGGQA
jgi:hypothetical protein